MADHAEGHSYGNSKMYGTTRMLSKKAPMEDATGNLGKAIGDTGRRNPIGNPKTKCDADRYKGSKVK